MFLTLFTLFRVGANMQAIETAWKQFFLQFVPYVFNEGELVYDEDGIIQDPENKLYPRITFDYSMGETFSKSLVTFKIWDYSPNNSGVWAVGEKLAKAIPSMGRNNLAIPADVIYEYKNPQNGTWVEFQQDKFQEIWDFWIKELNDPNFKLEWRSRTMSNTGEISFWRSTPFLQPIRQDEPYTKMVLSQLETTYLTTI